jgi:hypothetical protein
MKPNDIAGFNRMADSLASITSKSIVGLGLSRALTEDQKAVIDVVKETLAQALEGSITSIGIVACMGTGYATIVAGRQAADLNMGCDSLKRKIIDAVETQEKKP